MPPATDGTRGHCSRQSPQGCSSHIRMNQASSSNSIPSWPPCLMPVDAHSHCGERSSLRESSNLCERPREKQKKAAEGSHCKNQPPCPAWGRLRLQTIPSVFLKGKWYILPKAGPRRLSCFVAALGMRWCHFREGIKDWLQFEEV